MESTIVPSQSNKYAPNDPSGNFSFIGFFVSLPKIFFKVARNPEQLRDPACPERSAVFASRVPHRDRREQRPLCLPAAGRRCEGPQRKDAAELEIDSLIPAALPP